MGKNGLLKWWSWRGMNFKKCKNKQGECFFKSTLGTGHFFKEKVKPPTLTSLSVEGYHSRLKKELYISKMLLLGLEAISDELGIPLCVPKRNLVHWLMRFAFLLKRLALIDYSSLKWKKAIFLDFKGKMPGNSWRNHYLNMLLLLFKTKPLFCCHNIFECWASHEAIAFRTSCPTRCFPSWHWFMTLMRHDKVSEKRWPSFFSRKIYIRDISLPPRRFFTFGRFAS